MHTGPSLSYGSDAANLLFDVARETHIAPKGYSAITVRHLVFSVVAWRAANPFAKHAMESRLPWKPCFHGKAKRGVPLEIPCSGALQEEVEPIIVYQLREALSEGVIDDE